MHKKTPSLALVTPVFNRKDYTKRFLASLSSQTYRDFVVIITDDGSSDGTSDMIKEYFPDVILLTGDGNLWWSGGTNLAARHAIALGIPLILTINDDIELPSDYLENIMACSKGNPHALIGSKVCYRDDPKRVWYFGAKFSAKTGDMAHVTGQDSDFTETTASEWLTGMGVLIPADVFDKIGYFNRAEFPQYFGDAEFSVRAKNAGYELLVCPDARIYADVSAQWVLNQISKPTLRFPIELLTSIRSPYQLKTRLLFYRRHWPKHWQLSVLKLYGLTLKGLYISYFAAYIKKFLGIKSFRQLFGRKKK